MPQSEISKTVQQQWDDVERDPSDDRGGIATIHPNSLNPAGRPA